jgi:hypothetical protein
MVHSASGFIILCITLGFAIRAWSLIGYKVLNNLHSYFVFPTAAAVTFVAIGGIVTRIMLQRQVWNTHRALFVRKAHKTFGYAILLVSQCALATGMYYYRIKILHPSSIPLEWIHLGCWGLIVALLEFDH